MTDALKFPTNYQGARLPINYKAAKQALMECDRVDECKVWADKAEALATYARVSNDMEMEVIAKRVRLRAIAKAGELLLRIPNTHRGLHTAGAQLKGGSLPNPESRRGVGVAAGMRPQDVTQALAIARVPIEVREILIESPTPPAPSVLQGHPSRIRPRPVRLNRFTPGPEYREVFIHGGGITSFASFLKRHAPDKYFPFLSPDETERASRYLSSIHAWITEAQRLLRET
jgi:hypothetical protein